MLGIIMIIIWWWERDSHHQLHRQAELDNLTG